MHLYLVKRLDKIGWDECVAFVVRADSAKQARELAAAEAADEGPDVWGDETRASVELLGTCVTTDEPQAPIVLCSFHAG